MGIMGVAAHTGENYASIDPTWQKIYMFGGSQAPAFFATA